MIKSILPDYKITNIVSIWNIGPINITVDNRDRKKEYNAQKVKVDKGVFLLFASGAVTAVGFKSVETAEKSLKGKFPDRNVKFIRVSNIVVSSSWPFKLNTQKFTSLPNVMYEPEFFPAIYFRNKKVTLLYFHTGSIIITGAKLLKDIDEIIQQFWIK